MARDFTDDMARLTGFLRLMSRWREEHHELKTFLHCFLELEVFLFTATDLISSTSLFETTENLETSATSSCWVVVVVVVVLVLVPVDSGPCGTAEYLVLKSATI